MMQVLILNTDFFCMDVHIKLQMRPPSDSRNLQRTDATHMSKKNHVTFSSVFTEVAKYGC